MISELTELTKDLVANLLLRTPLRHFFIRTGRSDSIVFTLHRVACAEQGIGGHDLEALRRTLSQLRRLDVPIVSLREIIDAARGRSELSPNSVCFTLDDGYWDQAECTVPVFLEHGVQPTVFLITGFLDGLLWPWDAQVQELFHKSDTPSLLVRLGPACLKYETNSPASKRSARNSFIELCKSVDDLRREELISALAKSVGADENMPVPIHHRPMSWDQARALERQGVHFGSHSISHCVFSRVPSSKATNELEISRRRIMEELRDPIPVLAWPIGRRCDFGDRDLEIAARSGYEATVSMFGCNVSLQTEYQTDAPVLVHRHGFSDSTSQVLRMVFGLSRATAMAVIRDSLGFCGKVPQDRSQGHRLAEPAALDDREPKSRIQRSFDGSGIVWNRVQRLVFVCKGNICRSPYAEGRAREIGIEAVSCGIEAAPGAQADSAAARNACIRGVDLSMHRSRRLDQLEMYPTDLVVYMESGHREAVMRCAASIDLQHTMAGLWSSIPGAANAIVDPFGRDDITFQAVFERLDDIVANLTSRIAAAGPVAMRTWPGG